MKEDRLAAVYRLLLEHYGPRGWWPVTPPGGDRPAYSGGPRSDAQRFEVAAGAILTQNTAWSNAEKALVNLAREGSLDPAGVLALGRRRLAALLRPSGYFNQKAERLEALARFFLEGPAPSREALLAIRGIGPETADSIMLYAWSAPFFVVDAYTRRVFTRVGETGPGWPYEKVRSLFERRLPRDAALYQEYHALIVEHARSICRRTPLCDRCPVSPLCERSSPAGGRSPLPDSR